MKNGLVSIIIPCFNAGKDLSLALRSVSWQSYPEWECIIVDDGSTDDTGAIASAMQSVDSRFRYVRKEHSGLAATRNAGIDVANGEYLQFLDADDILLEGKLEECVGRLRSNPSLGATYTEYAYFKPPSAFFQILPAAIPSGDPLREFLFGWDVSFLIPVHAFLFRSTVFERQRFTDALGSHAEDVDCWIRLAAAGVRFGGIAAPLVVYCISGNSTSSQGTTLLSAKIRILETYRKDPACARLGAQFEVGIALLRQRLAMAYFREKNFPNGREIMAHEWAAAGSSARAKMLGWMILMKLVSSDTVANVRAWVVRATPFRWGAWSHMRSWDAPPSVRQLLESRG